jgi:hypothetical protein
MISLVALLGFLKGIVQMRLIALLLVIAILVVPLSTVEPFAQVIQSRLTTLTNVGDDQSAKARAGLYALVIDDALKEFIGQGNGTLGSYRQWSSGDDSHLRLVRKHPLCGWAASAIV